MVQSEIFQPDKKSHRRQRMLTHKVALVEQALVPKSSPAEAEVLLLFVVHCELIGGLLSEVDHNDSEYNIHIEDLLGELEIADIITFVDRALKNGVDRGVLVSALQKIAIKKGISSDVPRTAFEMLLTYFSETYLNKLLQESKISVTLQSWLEKFNLEPSTKTENPYGDFTMPKKGESYNDHLSKLIAWAKASVETKSLSRILYDREGTISYKDAWNLFPKIFYKHQEFFFEVFKLQNANKNGVNVRYTFRQVVIMEIIMQYEMALWGGGGVKPNQKKAFINDLLKAE